MKRKILPIFTLLLLTWTLFTNGFSAEAIHDPQQDTPPQGLFRQASVQIQLDQDDPSVMREQMVLVNWELLGGEGGPTYNDSDLVDRLPLNLFVDITYLAVLDRVEKLSSGGTIWEGHLEGIEMSHAIFVINDGVLVGKISSPEGIFRVRYVGGNLHAIQEIDQARLPHESEPIEIASDEPPAPFEMQDFSEADDGSVIDIMVLYTPQARADAGSNAAMESEIRLAIAEANNAYASSQVDFKLFLVFTTETTTYNDSGSHSTDLTNLRLGQNGLESVPTWRDLYHADSVALITESGGCGLGYVMTLPNDTTFHNRAFFMASRSCLTGNLTLPHEHGHNMGNRHDWFVDDSTSSPYNDSHGFANPSAGWRTIMAYNDWCDCTDEPTVPCEPDPALRITPYSPSCARLPYFSNPAIILNGNPLGVILGSSTACVEGYYSPNDPSTCDADAHRTLNLHDSVTAGFRLSEVFWTGEVSETWTDDGNWEILQGAPGARSPVNRAPRAIDDVYIPASPVGGRFPTIASGTINVREVRLQDGAQLTLSGGTLNVYGDWIEEGAGGLNASGGTVIFLSASSQQVTTSLASTFNHVQIGDGISTTRLEQMTDMRLNGDLTIQSGTTFEAGDYTIQIAGDWTDERGGFVPGTSTITFDGVTQTLDLVNTSTELLNQDFSQWDGSCCTISQPSGWLREVVDGYGFAMGQLTTYTDSAANLWSNSTDGWLFTRALELLPGVNYELSYQYRPRYGAPQPVPVYFNVYLASAQNSASISTLISSVSSSTPTYQDATGTFTVDTPGNYYLAFRVQKDNSATQYGSIDNVIVTGYNQMRFHNLEVQSNSFATPLDDMIVLNDLVITGAGQLWLDGVDLSVEGTLTNNGSLRQSRDVPYGTTTRFLHIKNQAGDTVKYEGLDLTPEITALGNTTVTVRGNHPYCEGNNATVERCFFITPSSSEAASIRFWYLDNEKGSIDPANAFLYHWNGSDWDALVMAATPNGSEGVYHWADAVGVSSYSPFSIAGPGADLDAPTAVELVSFMAEPQANAVYLSWETQLEIDMLGYNLYRSRIADRAGWIKLNPELIPPQSLGELGGGQYSFEDMGAEPGRIFFYWLEAIEIDAVRTFDPISAMTWYQVYTPLVVR